ncbi:GIN domain-containing protein [Flavobacterium cyanobacteriorum]|uniref:GIN domain-containing protein n=1 Tax=Flavobacterium cyanobacteriorum TaxID=2022802 RepID=UPI0013FD17C8|nr:DUF2807 domain-containing protein [Flavobacterium cyanobacteriorum]
MNKFSEISISGKIKVEILEFEQDRILITKGEKYLKYNVLKERLTITSSAAVADSVTITVYFKDINKISAANKPVISIKMDTQRENFTLDVKESSSVTGFIKSTNFKLLSQSGSSVSLEGSCDNADIKAGGKSSVEAQKIIFKKCDIELTDSGARVFVTDKLNAELTKSRLEVSGNPAKFNKKVSPDSVVTNPL